MRSMGAIGQMRSISWAIGPTRQRPLELFLRALGLRDKLLLVENVTDRRVVIGPFPAYFPT